MNLQKIFDEVCEVACVKFGGFGDVKDKITKFLLYLEYLNNMPKEILEKLLRRKIITRLGLFKKRPYLPPPFGLS